MQQITVRGMQLHQIEARLSGIGDSLAEIVDDPGDLVSIQRARRGSLYADGLAVFVTQRGAGSRIDSGWRDGRLSAWLQAGV
ncbi:Uncharacterised protein [Salmonella enterica subsp. enterica serovar Typhimurium str. DT104]|nr:Uncharacterised protein [Salmonella enterica subsp. enterica serovar Typhimurium str. DT104]